MAKSYHECFRKWCKLPISFLKLGAETQNVTDESLWCKSCLHNFVVNIRMASDKLSYH